MAKKKYTAVHRILTKTKPLTYIEPGTAFQMEEAEGEKLVKLGAAKAGGETEAKASTAKKTTAPKKTEAPTEGGGDDDLV